MTWHEAKQVASRHFESLGSQWRARGYRWPDCLRGAILPLTEYECDEDLRTLKPEEPPGMTCADQRIINRAFSRLVKKHGAFPRRHLVRTRDYLQWLAENGKKNSASSRAEFSLNHAPMIAHFDPHDRARIEDAVTSQKTGEIALAIDRAVDGFSSRLVEQFKDRGHIAREIVLMRPATAFDDVVIRLTLQIVADSIGDSGIKIVWLPNEAGIGSPDVVFLDRDPDALHDR